MAVRTARIRGATEMRGPTGVVLALLYARAVLASPWLGCELLLGDRLLDARAVARVPVVGGRASSTGGVARVPALGERGIGGPALLGSASCCSRRPAVARRAGCCSRPVARGRAASVAGVARVRELLLDARAVARVPSLGAPGRRYSGPRAVALGDRLLLDVRAVARVPVARGARHRRAGVARVRELLLSATGCCSTRGLLLASP